MNTSSLLIALGALTAPVNAFAQVAPPVVASAPDAPALAPVDPARLAIARSIADRLMPPGAYKKLMAASMGAISGNMASMIKALPMRQIAEMGGATAQQAAALGKIDIGQVMAIYDPHWEERSTLTMNAMTSAMGDFMTSFEPRIRDAWAHAYARDFSLADLQSIAGFFATPAGSKYAASVMTISAGPDMTAATRSMMPELIGQMPTLMAKAKTATAALPPPRKLQDLSPAEREKLGKLLGVKPSDLKDPKPVA